MHPIVYYILIFLLLGAWGMARANRLAVPAVRKQRWLKYFTYILITGTVLAGMFFHFMLQVALVIAFASVIEVIRVSEGKGRTAFWGIVFIGIVLGLFLRFTLHFRSDFQVFIYFQVLVFDGFSQITGQLWGRHQLAPKISPAKTREGFLGGWACCVMAALLAANWVPFSLVYVLLFGIFTGLTGLAGDLLASWYKRLTGVRDYSNWLPGQGGFLDRFDSFIITAACYELLATKLPFTASFMHNVFQP